MEKLLAKAAKQLEEQEKIQQTLVKVLDEKVKQFAKLKQTIETKKIQRSNADFSRQIKSYRIVTFEKFFEDLMKKKEEQFKLELTKRHFNEEEVDKFFLVNAYENLLDRMEELDDKYSSDIIIDNIKKVEENTMEMQNSIVTMQTSNKRKKKLLHVDFSDQEQDIDDAITNSTSQLEIITENVKAKKDRVRFMELKKEQLMKDIKDKETVVTRREAAEQNFRIQFQALEPDRFHSQQLKEGNNEELSISKTQ